MIVRPQMEQCFLFFDLHCGPIENGTTLTRHLSDLRDLFAHRTDYDQALAQDDLVIYPAHAGRYGRVDQGEGFRHVIVEVDGKPKMLNRQQYLKQLSRAVITI